MGESGKGYAHAGGERLLLPSQGRRSVLMFIGSTEDGERFVPHSQTPFLREGGITE